MKNLKKIDYKDAKKDVIPFISDNNSLNLWNEDFFIDITNNINGN